MSRLVLDTNVLISAVGWRGAAYHVWEACLQGRHHLVTSRELLDEIERVLARPRFAFLPEEERQLFLVSLTAIVELVAPPTRLDVIKDDPTDNRVLECAVEGQVDVILSGDRHLLDLKAYHAIPIVTAKAFLQQHPPMLPRHPS